MLTATAISASEADYRPDIDGLRAVAVAAVVTYHLEESWLPGGFVGVDIFFVISGFVVAASLLRRQSASVGTYFAAFYSRRVKRLSPALVLVTLLTAVELNLLVPSSYPSLPEYYASGIAGLVGGANFYLSLLGSTNADVRGEDMSGYFGQQVHAGNRRTLSARGARSW